MRNWRLSIAGIGALLGCGVKVVVVGVNFMWVSGLVHLGPPQNLYYQYEMGLMQLLIPSRAT